MKFIDYNINTEIVNDLPKIELELTYKDKFFDDHYLLRSKPEKDTSSENILFELFKNGEKQSEFSLLKGNVDEFMSQFFVEIDDHDFKEEFYKKDLAVPISNEIDDFLKRYDDIVVSAEITTEGEIKRMKKIAGLL
jgi:hypothetical protein